MKKTLLAFAFILLSSCTCYPAYAGGGGGKSAPASPAAPTPPPAPQAPQDPNTANAIAREKTRRSQGGGNQDTQLTGSGGAPFGPNDLSTPVLGNANSYLGK